MKTEEILELLDQVVLLAVAHGEKSPLAKGWTDFTLDKMKDPQYLQTLNRGNNIGVKLGEDSENLCTVDLDKDDALKLFLDLNLKLKDTLQTRRGRGANFWLRIIGNYPASGAIKDAGGKKLGEWRANGNQTVICGEAKDREPPYTLRPYFFINKVRPIEICFEEINWPVGWGLSWKENPEPEPDHYPNLVQQYGTPHQVGKSGKTTLNQMFFVAKFATEHLILHEPEEREFYTYDQSTGIWKIQTSERVKNQFSSDLKNYADSQNLSQIIMLRTNSLLNHLTELLRGEVEKRDIFEQSYKAIHLSNGVLHLDLDPVQLKQFSPEYYSRNRCPYELVEGTDCPQFKKELLKSALEEDDIDLLQRWCGSVLLKGNSAQKILLLVGTAGGGKSTLLEILEKIIGTENVEQLRTELLCERFEISRFIGKTLLAGKDVAGNFLETKGAHVLKALVGHDLLSAEKKGSNSRFHVRGTFGIAITCNSRLKVRLDGDTEAWRRRLLIIRYDKTKPEKPIRNFAETLLETEAPGILNWMIEGAIKHLAELKETGEYQLSRKQADRISSLLAESDSVREFVRRCIVPAQFADVCTDDLVEAYNRFCDNWGWEALPLKKVQSQLADAIMEIHRISKRHDIKRDGRSRNGFFGLQIMEESL